MPPVAPSARNLGRLFGYAALLFVGISYAEALRFALWPQSMTPDHAAAAIGIFGLMALCCGLFSGIYWLRARRFSRGRSGSALPAPTSRGTDGAVRGPNAAR